MFAYVQTRQTVHIKCAHFFVGQLYLNKAIENTLGSRYDFLSPHLAVEETEA